LTTVPGPFPDRSPGGPEPELGWSSGAQRGGPAPPIHSGANDFLIMRVATSR
jgi:hypothetical protein